MITVNLKTSSSNLTSIHKVCIRPLSALAFATSLLVLSACTMTDVTSSTSNTLDAVTPDITLNRFVDVRIAAIQQEAAAGEGENLEALAQLMGQQDKAAFADWMQSNYQVLFDELKQPAQLISRIDELSASNSI